MKNNGRENCGPGLEYLYDYVLDNMAQNMSAAPVPPRTPLAITSPRPSETPPPPPRPTTITMMVAPLVQALHTPSL